MEKTVLKWFDMLDLPLEWKPSVIEGLKDFDFDFIHRKEAPYAWLYEQENKMLCLLYALCMCEEFFQKGLSKGISEEILIHTMQEVRRHAQNYNKYYQKIGISQIKWIGTVLSGRLYCLGRLEFEMKTTKKEYKPFGVEYGDKVMGVHIPRTGGAMSDEEVASSLKEASDFFPKYFPDFDYKCYTCHSWLLDPTLCKLLRPDSNIVLFQKRFEVTETKESASGLGSIFGGGTSYDNVLSKKTETSLQKAAYEHIKNGGKLYEGFGFMPR